VLLPSVAHAQEKLNMVFMIADDQGWGEYGFMRHSHIKSPALIGM